MVKHDYTKADIRRMAKEENVQFLRLMFTDLYGTIKNVEVPISQLDKLLDNKLMFDGSSIDGFVRIEESDMWLYPDLSTWIIRILNIRLRLKDVLQRSNRIRGIMLNGN